MTRLDQEHDVVALARSLALRDNPVEAVVRFCEERIGRWAEDHGGVETVTALEELVADRLQLVFEDVCSDGDLDGLIAKYVAQGEYVFATLRDELDPTTFGLTIKRKRWGPESSDKYVAVIDCRGEKGLGGSLPVGMRSLTCWSWKRNLIRSCADRRTTRSSPHGRNCRLHRILRTALRPCLRPRAESGSPQVQDR